MIWMNVIIFLIIVFFFIISYIGIYSKNQVDNRSVQPSGSLKVNTLLPEKSISCLKSKVSCDFDGDCFACNDTETMKCVTIREQDVKEYSYRFKKSDVTITYDGDNKNVKNVKGIKIPNKSIDNKNIDIKDLNNIDIIYIDYKFYDSTIETDILNGNYGNFISYKFNSPKINGDFITIDNIYFNRSNVVYDVPADGDVVIKWFQIRYNNKGYCLKAADEVLPDCVKENGGLLTWTGWTNPESMSWSCLCRYPTFFNGSDCSKLNPNVCMGGTFIVEQRKAPVEGICKCPNGKELIKDYRGVPYCVDPQLKNWYTTYFDTSGDIIQDIKIKN
jgi:hypothetical protein